MPDSYANHAEVRNGPKHLLGPHMAHAGGERQGAARKRTFAGSPADRAGNSRGGWIPDLRAGTMLTARAASRRTEKRLDEDADGRTRFRGAALDPLRCALNGLLDLSQDAAPLLSRQRVELRLR